jgi:hypothetical protein
MFNDYKNENGENNQYFEKNKALKRNNLMQKALCPINTIKHTGQKIYTALSSRTLAMKNGGTGYLKEVYNYNMTKFKSDLWNIKRQLLICDTKIYVLFNPKIAEMDTVDYNIELLERRKALGFGNKSELVEREQELKKLKERISKRDERALKLSTYEEYIIKNISDLRAKEDLSTMKLIKYEYSAFLKYYASLLAKIDNKLKLLSEKLKCEENNGVLSKRLETKIESLMAKRHIVKSEYIDIELQKDKMDLALEKNILFHELDSNSPEALKISLNGLDKMLDFCDEMINYYISSIEKYTKRYETESDLKEKSTANYKKQFFQSECDELLNTREFVQYNKEILQETCNKNK